MFLICDMGAGREGLVYESLQCFTIGRSNKEHDNSRGMFQKRHVRLGCNSVVKLACTQPWVPSPALKKKIIRTMSMK
jgi:hypothetical protein